MNKAELIKWHLGYLGSKHSVIPLAMHRDFLEVKTAEELQKSKEGIEEQERIWRSKPPKVCSICKIEYYGWGNNAWPVNNGRCCDTCNQLDVIPARFARVSDNP